MSSPPSIIWLDSLHRNEQISRLKLIYEESVSAFAAGCTQLSDLTKSIVIKIMNILRYYCHSKGENGFLPHIFEVHEISYFLATVKNKGIISLRVTPCRFLHMC